MATDDELDLLYTDNRRWLSYDKLYILYNTEFVLVVLQK